MKSCSQAGTEAQAQLSSASSSPLSAQCPSRARAQLCGHPSLALQSFSLSGGSIPQSSVFTGEERRSSRSLGGSSGRAFHGGREVKAASLPTDQLSVHGVLLVRAGERDSAADHGPDDVDQPGQASCKQHRASGTTTQQLPRAQTHGIRAASGAEEHFHTSAPPEANCTVRGEAERSQS